MQERRYLTAADVTAALNIDRSTVYRMAEDGRLPGVKVGRQWRFHPDAVERALGIERPPVVEPSLVTTTVPLLRLFAELYGVMVVMTDIEGHPLTPVINPSPYFRQLSSDQTAIEACTVEWRAYADEAIPPVPRTSHLGFECARAFVRNGYELSGMVIAGGLAPRSEICPDFEALAAQHDTDAETLRRSWAELPDPGEPRRQEIIDGLSTLAHHLSTDQEGKELT